MLIFYVLVQVIMSPWPIVSRCQVVARMRRKNFHLGFYIKILAVMLWFHPSSEPIVVISCNAYFYLH